MSIGGRTYGEPILAKHSDGHLEVFVIGLDGHLFRKHQIGPNGSFVADWTGFSTNFNVLSYSEEVLFDPLTTRISWAIHQNGSMYIFARTIRGRVVYAFTGSFPSGWSDWKSISAIQDGHPVMGNPVATSAITRDEAISLWVRSRNGAVLHKKLLDGAIDDWGDPNRWTNHDGEVSGEPVVGSGVRETTFQTNVYVRGLDRNLYWIGETFTGGSHGPLFGPWLKLFNDSFPGAKLTGQPVINSPLGSGVTWRGLNGNLWMMNQSSFGVFSGPIDSGIQSASDPAVISFGGNTWTFWQSSSGQLMMQRRRPGSGPESPVSLASGVISKPSANTSQDGRVEVVFVGSDASIFHLWETAVGSGTFGEGS